MPTRGHFSNTPKLARASGAGSNHKRNANEGALFKHPEVGIHRLIGFYGFSAENLIDKDFTYKIPVMRQIRGPQKIQTPDRLRTQIEPYLTRSG